MFLYFYLAGLVAAVSCFGLLDDAWRRNGDGKAEVARSYKAITGLLVAAVLVCAWWLTAQRSADIGSDTKNYISIFLAFREGLQLYSRYELGFQLYCFFLGQFTADPHVFLQVTATIMYVALGMYIFRYSENPALSICLAFCFAFPAFANEMRQSFALLIILFAYQQLKRGHTVRFVVLVVVASLFHLTALIALLLILYRFAPNRFGVVFIVGAIVVGLCVTGIFADLIRPFLGTYYSRYLSNSYASSGWTATAYYVLRACALCLIIYLCTKGARSDEREAMLARWTFALLVFVSALGFSMNLFSRVAQFFLFVSISELPNMICRADIPNRKAICALIGIVFLAFFLVVLVFRPEWNHLYPYQVWA